MRWLLPLLLIACSTEGDGGKDTTDDTDGDDTDLPYIVYTPVEPAAPFVRAEYEGVGFVSWAPEGVPPVALAMLFHGTGGTGAGMVDTVEMLAVVNELIANNIAFVAPDCIDRATGQFDDASPTGSNPDFQLISHMRDDMISRGVMTAQTPLVSLGFSAGGAFAAYMGHAGPDAGWPVVGVMLHNSSSWSQKYGKPSSLPHMWMAAEHDDRVSYDETTERYEEHIDAGREGVWAPHFEMRLYPTRFVRTTYFTPAQSQQVFDEAVRGGFFSDRGERLFPIEELDAAVRDFTTNYDVIYAKPVTAQLNVVLAAHAINGEHAEAEAQFILDHAVP